MTRLTRLLLPVALIAIASAWAFTLVGAQSAFDGGVKPYKFVLGSELSGEEAKKAVVKPAFKAVADDRFDYEVYFNIRRSGASSDANGAAGGFARTETWVSQCNLTLEEDDLTGRKDLRAAFRYESLYFDLVDGQTSYSGYIGPKVDDGGAGHDSTFWKVDADGSRTTAFQIPGWLGVNARSVENSRNTQAGPGSASAWVSVSDTGRLHDEVYFADFDSSDQRNYPARLLDPVHIVSGLMPEFAAGASAQLGAELVIRRRMPVGPLPGATIDYDLTYTLEKVYGPVTEPTAAQFKFSGKAVSAEHTQRVGGMDLKFTAPEIKDGLLLLDLVKGVSAVVRWKYALKGEISEPGSARRATFGSEAEFSASLRKQK